jgi:hypothetical protein
MFSCTYFNTDFLYKIKRAGRMPALQGGSQRQRQRRRPEASGTKGNGESKRAGGCRRLGKKAILPIWHKITRRDLLKYSPAFADRIAKVSQRDSMSDIVKGLKALLKKG